MGFLKLKLSLYFNILREQSNARTDFLQAIQFSLGFVCQFFKKTVEVLTH